MTRRKSGVYVHPNKRYTKSRFRFEPKLKSPISVQVQIDKQQVHCIS